MSRIAEDIKTHLIASSEDITSSNVFIDYIPDQPDKLIGIMCYGGVSPSLALVGAEQSKLFQIWGRDVAGANAWSFCKTVKDILYSGEEDGLVTINSRECIIKPLSDIKLLKKENNRFNYYFEFEIISGKD